MVPMPSVTRYRPFHLPQSESELIKECKLFIFWSDSLLLQPFPYLPSLMNKCNQENIVQDLLEELKDGWYMLHLLHLLIPEIDLPKQKAQNHFQLLSFWEKFLRLLVQWHLVPPSHAYRPQMFMEKNSDCLLNLFYHLLKENLLQPLSLQECPELIWTLEGNEIGDYEINDGELWLKRWLNYHLKIASYPKIIQNFHHDLNDGTAYVSLLQVLYQKMTSLDEILLMKTDLQKHEQILNILSLKTNIDLASVFDALSLSQGNPRQHFLLCMLLMNNQFGLPNLPTPATLNQLFCKLDQYKQQIQQLQQQTAIQEQQMAQKMLRREHEYKQLRLIMELKTKAKIHQLESDLYLMKKESHLDQESLVSKLQWTQQTTRKKMKKILDRVERYREKREEVFEDHKVVKVSAFNNEGKKVEFQVPTPSLKRAIVFDFDDDPQEEEDISNDEIHPQSNSYSTGIQCQINEPGQRKRCLSAPPDVLLDQIEKIIIPSEIKDSPDWKDSEVELKSEMKEIEGSLQELMIENMSQLQQIQLLTAKVDELNWLNQTMGDKIKAFTSQTLLKSQK